MTDAQPASPDEADCIRNRVGRFYESHPYPLSVNTLDRYRASWDSQQRRSAAFHTLWPSLPYRNDRSVLVAGCGTSQAAKHALRWPNARVTGIDLSEASIRATQKLKQRYDLDNLELATLALEEVATLEQRFDQIVCTGVLHHLADPAAGLSALRDVLAPDGALHMMLYAPYGRIGVYMIQDYCRLLGIGTSSAEIRDLAATLGALPPAHPIAGLLRNAPDFRDEAGIADALLHPQDRPYSVPEMLALLGQCGLRFGRWLRQAPYSPTCGSPLSVPHQQQLVALSKTDQYAAMELYRGTMLRHSAIVYRDDFSGDPQAIDFEHAHWPDYVPIRLPETICVEERLPPGAEGVLINRNHSDTDIYLPVDRQQKDWVESIDGQRTIAELLGDKAASPSARQFFERLWQYDQIVIDASRASVTP
jgi:SAM-dependent methyltransferase